VSRPAGSPYAVSSFSQIATIAATWSTPLTLGSVIVNGSGQQVRNRSRVRSARRRVAASRLLIRMPANGGRTPSCSAAAAALTAASSCASSRTP
jgi:hypothetical protein